MSLPLGLGELFDASGARSPPPPPPRRGFQFFSPAGEVSVSYIVAANYVLSDVSDLEAAKTEICNAFSDADACVAELGSRRLQGWVKLLKELGLRRFWSFFPLANLPRAILGTMFTMFWAAAICFWVSAGQKKERAVCFPWLGCQVRSRLRCMWRPRACLTLFVAFFLRTFVGILQFPSVSFFLVCVLHPGNTFGVLTPFRPMRVIPKGVIPGCITKTLRRNKWPGGRSALRFGEQTCFCSTVGDHPGRQSLRNDAGTGERWRRHAIRAAQLAGWKCLARKLRAQQERRLR